MFDFGIVERSQFLLLLHILLHHHLLLHAESVLQLPLNGFHFFFEGIIKILLLIMATHISLGYLLAVNLVAHVLISTHVLLQKLLLLHILDKVLLAQLVHVNPVLVLELLAVIVQKSLIPSHFVPYCHQAYLVN